MGLLSHWSHAVRWNVLSFTIIDCLVKTESNKTTYCGRHGLAWQLK